jgi:hypothetical protein
VVFEYQQAYVLFYNKLLFQAKDLILIESWKLKNNLDLEDFSSSWLSYPSNSKFLEGTKLVLFRRI